MATAQEPTGPSGKTGGFEANKECDLCGSTTPVKYCPECEFTLCPICSKGHGKIQSTKDHALLDIALTRSSASYAKSGDVESGPSLCIKHPKSVLQLYCEQCILLICDECRPNHNDHTVQSIKDDLKMYQNICTQHIKRLLDKTHDLEEHKTLISGAFTNYDEAIQMVMKWEEELVQLVQECSRSLREDLEKAKKEWEDVVHDDETGLTKMAVDVENKLSKLHSIRKVTDFDIFSRELADSQELLAKVNNFMENNLATLTVPTLSDILPNTSKLPIVKTGIVDLTTGKRTHVAVASQGSSGERTSEIYGKATTHFSTSYREYPLPNLFSPTQIFEFSVTDPYSHQGYRINKTSGESNHIMIHGSCKKDIIFLNKDGKALERHKSKCEMNNVISIRPNEYVAVRLNHVYLLDSKFEITANHTSDKACKCVSFLFEREFLLLESKETNKQHQAHISRISMKDYQFIINRGTSIEVEEKIKFIETDEHKTYAFICGSTHMYKVKLDGWNIQHVHMSQWLNVEKIWSVCVVGDHLLVGDSAGKIHLLDTQLTYKKVILKIATAVKDMALHNGQLVVSSMDNKIYMYK